MTELYLRTWHRRFGIFLALFIFLQALSGVLLNFEEFLEVPLILTWAKILHRGGGTWGIIYRTGLGLALMAMAISGSLIFIKMWRRTRKN